MTLEQMQKYCSTDMSREYLMTPFTMDGFTYSTNGHIIVRVPAIEGAECRDKVGADRVFQFATDELYSLSFPTLPPVPDTKEVECSDCEGTGHEHPNCDKCECDCLNCDGAGTEKIEPKKYVLIDGGLFDLKYVTMLAELAPIRIARRTENQQPLYFRFEGGEGALMGCRSCPEDDICADLKSK
jgi:hypothetical protein